MPRRTTVRAASSASGATASDSGDLLLARHRQESPPVAAVGSGELGRYRASAPNSGTISITAASIAATVSSASSGLSIRDSSDQFIRSRGRRSRRHGFSVPPHTTPRPFIS
jgi:hypothetical protein